MIDDSVAANGLQAPFHRAWTGRCRSDWMLPPAIRAAAATASGSTEPSDFSASALAHQGENAPAPADSETSSTTSTPAISNAQIIDLEDRALTSSCRELDASRRRCDRRPRARRMRHADEAAIRMPHDGRWNGKVDRIESIFDDLDRKPARRRDRGDVGSRRAR